ncbi:hypothetical protein [Exiguobacterium antarcticum]|nr:hypothetical protein [Exiguobacterium antarcticum]
MYVVAQDKDSFSMLKDPDRRECGYYG